jgi:aquaporin rerated protein, other eukaryote
MDPQKPAHHHGVHGMDAGTEQHKHRHQLNPIQKHLVAASGEFVGTFLFLWLAYAGHIMAVSQEVASAPAGGHSNQTIIIIALAYSFPLLVNVWAFYRISGGLFNPAVSCTSSKRHMV